jgi:hypothetical protein
MKIFNKKIENIKFITFKNKKSDSLFFKNFKFYQKKKNYLSKFPHRLELKSSKKTTNFYENSIYKNKINSLFFSNKSKHNHEAFRMMNKSRSFAFGLEKNANFSLLLENKIDEERITRKVGVENKEIDRLIQANLWKIFSLNNNPQEISHRNNRTNLSECKNNRKPESLLKISKIKSNKSDSKIFLLKINEILKDLTSLFGT